MDNKKKNSKGKGILLVLTVFVVLALATAGLFLMVGSNSDGKKAYEAENSKQVNQLTADQVATIEEIDTQESAAPSQGSNEQPPLPMDEQQVLDQELEKMEDARKQEVLKYLAMNYSNIMLEQKEEALSMLDALIDQGKAEWEEILRNGENTPIVKGEKVSEYLAMVSVMEANMDQSIETVLATMKKQLEAENIDAEPIINQYREKYNAVKQENRKIMMDKAFEAIKGEE